MTLEQEIRNSSEDGNLIGMTAWSVGDVEYEILDDLEGVLKIKVSVPSESERVVYLNGDKYYDTHEEAFQAEI